MSLASTQQLLRASTWSFLVRFDWRFAGRLCLSLLGSISLAVLTGCVGLGGASAPKWDNEPMPIRADTLSGHGAYYRNAPSDTTFYPSLFESLVLEAGKGIEESTFRSDSSTAHRDCVYLWFEDPKTIHVTLLRDGAKVGEKTVKGQVSDEGTYELNANRSIAGYPPFLNVYAAQKTWMAWTAPQTLQVHRALETVGFLVVMPFDGDDYVFRSTYRKVSNPWTDC